MAERGANFLPLYRLFYGFERTIFGAVLYAAVLRHKETPLRGERGVRRSAAAIARTQAGPGAQALGVALQEECLGCGNIFDLGGIHRLIGGVNGALGLLHTVEGDLRVRMRLLQLGG